MMDELAYRVEEAGLNGWPALNQLLFDGWILRLAGGYTRRANSVNPLSPGSRDLRDKIVCCEALYRRQNLPTIFRLGPWAGPDLAAELDQRGYSVEDDNCVLFMDLGGIDDRLSDPGVMLMPTAGEDWLAA